MHKTQDEEKQIKKHNIICVGHVVFFYLLLFVLCLVYSGVQHMLYCVFCFVCLRLVYSGVQHMLYCVFFYLLLFVLCLVHSGVQHMLCCVFLYKTQDEEKQIKKHNITCVGHHYSQGFCICLSSSCVLWIVVANTYCVVFFYLLLFVLCLVHSGVQHMLCCVHNITCVGHHHTQDTRRRQTKQKTQHNMCWTPLCTRHKTKRSK
jgi:hypothetical protein